MNWWVLAASSCLPSILFLSQTHTCKIGGRQILVLHRRCNRHPESDIYYYNMFTCIFSVLFFFVQQYQRGARQKWFTPRERKKLVKIKKYNYLCPAVTLHKWKERPTLDTKISQFLYIKQPVVALFRNQKRIFTFCLFFFWLLLAVPIVRRTPTRFASTSALFYFLFHITKLHFYSHIFKFKFLFWYALQKATTLSHLLNSSYSSIKASK